MFACYLVQKETLLSYEKEKLPLKGLITQKIFSGRLLFNSSNRFDLFAELRIYMA